MAKRRESETEPERVATPDDPKGSRLTIQLDESGGIAWDRMRPSTKEQLIGKLKDDPRFKSTGTAPGAAASSGDIFSDPHAAMLFDLVGRLEVTLAMRAYRCTQEQANILLYTDQEKAILTGPLVKVLNKYGASWMTKYGDEITLAGLLVAVHAPKLIALQDAMKPKPQETRPIQFVKTKDVESS
jgi:hypothetical protein